MELALGGAGSNRRTYPSDSSSPMCLPHSWLWAHSGGRQISRPFCLLVPFCTVSTDVGAESQRAPFFMTLPLAPHILCPVALVLDLLPQSSHG